MFRVVVTTNSSGELYETASSSNNRRVADAPLSIAKLARPDLQVESVFAPLQVTPGGLASVGFKVANRGTAAAAANWTDLVYLSLDNRLTYDDLLLSSLPNGAAIAVNDDPYRSDTPSVVIPERYRGDIFFLVVTDGGDTVNEWPNEGNNVTAFKSFAEPLPLPDLVVSEVQSSQQIAAGSEIQVGYTVTNLGSGATLVDSWVETIWLTVNRDRPHPGLGDVLLHSFTENRGSRLARNAGYDQSVTVQIPDWIEPGNWFIMPWVDPYDAVLEDTLAININPDDPNQLDNNNYKAFATAVLATEPDLEIVTFIADGQGAGGTTFNISYRVENRGNGPTKGGFFDKIYLSDQADPFALDARTMTLLEIPRPSGLAAGEGYTYDLPITLSPSAVGQYVFVRTDIYQQIDEVSKTNNDSLATTDVRPVPADLVVTDVIFEQDNLSGESTVIRYTVTNNGDYPVWAGTQSWKDFIWVSADPVFDRMRASFLGETVHVNSRPLGVGESYEVILRTTWPIGAAGEYYLHIHLDGHNDYSPFINPYQARVLLTDWWPADSGDNQSWVDYFRGWSFEDPRNNLHSERVDITYREPDLRVTSFEVPPAGISGEELEVNYSVTNRGSRATRGGSWVDRLFLSLDPSLDSADLYLGEASHSGVLASGQSYSDTIKASLPEGIAGPFYLLTYVDAAAFPWPYAQSNIGFNLSGIDFERPSPLAPWDLASEAQRNLGRGRVPEFQDEGNNILVHEFPVQLASAPDLRVTAVKTPDRAIRGQEIDVTYTVSNRGTGDTPESQSNWRDLIYLSRDPSLDLRADRYVYEVPHEGVLQADGSYSNTVTIQLPTDLLGPWFVIPVTDPVRIGTIGDVFENGREKNERASAFPVVISLPPPADLRVQGIVGPPEARVGNTVDLRWTVRNTSLETAAGTWYDSVYLSSDGVWDVNDRLLGRTSFTGNVLPGQEYDSVLTARIPAVTPGNYRLIVRADIFNQVYEDQGDANNITAATDVMRIRAETVQFGSTQSIAQLFGADVVAQTQSLSVGPNALDGIATTQASGGLQLGVTVQTTLDTDQERLFELEVPADQTLRIRLRGGGENAIHELYVRHREAPFLNEYDATSETQLASELTAVIPNTKPGTYYILIRGRSEPQVATSVTLIAELLPLAITSIHTDVGGDGRFVTTTIRGARFHENATVKLLRPGFAEFVPVAWKVIDPATVRATFDFTGAPHGLYDLQVTNPDGATALIPYRFLVEQAIEPDVTIGLGGPRIVMAGETGLYSVAFQSLSNLDTPYTFFQVGLPEMGINEFVYDLPFVRFASNVRRAPNDESLANVPWDQLNSAINTDGQVLAPGYVLDLPADGFTGFSFSAVTYPGLKELNDHAFKALKQQLYRAFPHHAKLGTLDDGPQGLSKISPQIATAWELFGGVPDLFTKPFIPFQFHITAAATALTRDEFIAQSRSEASRLRQGILDDANAPPGLLTLAADADAWQELYLESLVESGLLRASDVPPPARERVATISLMATLATGVLAGPGGAATTRRQLARLLRFAAQMVWRQAGTRGADRSGRARIFRSDLRTAPAGPAQLLRRRPRFPPPISSARQPPRTPTSKRFASTFHGLVGELAVHYPPTI